MRSSGSKLICEGCTHKDKPAWEQQTIRDLGVGLTARRVEAQNEGKRFANQLKAPSDEKPNDGFIAIQE